MASAMPAAPVTLPMTAALPALVAALAERPRAIVTAPPGAGKTTLVPPALLDAPWRGDRRIVMLEPRRLAARAAATRMAASRGEAVGGLIGYRTRLEARVSAATRIEVITEGLLLRRLLTDPGLEGVAAVILDEVHERSLDADLALALCCDLQRTLRPELRLIVMSATAETERLATLLDAAIIAAPSRAHPITLRHAERDIASPRDLPRAMASAVRAALAEHQGDILAFLPGMAEIRSTEALLAGCGALVAALHGDLPPAEQDRALSPATCRRVVLASAIAETSLTVPGVRVVIDGGFRRAPCLDAATGLTRLTTERISRASAEQRAGRAGREAPGVVIRLWTAALHRGLKTFDRPEILAADLSPLVLACAAWGTPPEDLPFPDAPPAGGLATARALLGKLGALAGENRLSEAGARMTELAAHPRLAAMMLAAETLEEKALSADLAALLEERDPLRGADSPADIGLRLALLGDQREARTPIVGRILRASAQYRRRLGVRPGTPPAGDPARLLAAGFPDRIAARRGEPGSFRLSGGGGARLPLADPLARAAFLVAPAIEAAGAARIRLAASLAIAALPATIAQRISETVETSVDPATGQVYARRRRRLGALVLEDHTEPAAPEARQSAFAAWLKADPARLPWSPVARQTQARVARLALLEPGAWPDVSDAAIAARLAARLAAGRLPIARPTARDLMSLLQEMLTEAQRARLARELPETLELPHGRAPIDYTAPVPLATARAQAFFGLSATPALAGGRVALQLALLSPGGRPVAIIGDLGKFWREGWAEVRRAMRGRYPKHAWPEDGAAEGKGK